MVVMVKIQLLKENKNRNIFSCPSRGKFKSTSVKVKGKQNNTNSHKGGNIKAESRILSS